MVCLTGKSSRHRVSLCCLSAEVGEAIMGLWEPWASPPWSAAVGRAGGKARKEMSVERQAVLEVGCIW